MNVDEFIGKVEGTKDHDIFTPRVFYRLDGKMFAQMCELLKKQEAKCLTKDELVELYEQQFVWVEGQVGYLYCVRIIGICTGENGVTDIQFDTPASFVEFSTQIYGASYRIWTAEPTDEQRQAVKWG